MGKFEMRIKLRFVMLMLLAISAFNFAFKVDAVNNTEANTVKETKIGEGFAPEIMGVSFIEIPKGNSFNPLEGVMITDLEDGHISLDAPHLIIEGSVNTDVPGVYKLVYKAKDSNDNVTAVTRVVAVSKPNEVVVGDYYILKASEYSLRVSEVNNVSVSNEAILSSINAKLYDKETGNEVINPLFFLQKGIGGDVFRVGVGVGTYPLRISTYLENNLLINTNVSVETGRAPVIIGEKFIEVVKGNQYDLYSYGMIIDDEDGAIANESYEIDSNVDFNVADIYHVVYTVVDSDGNRTSKDVVLVVSSPDEVVVGDKYIIKAYDFQIRVGQVTVGTASDNYIVNEACVEVYDKETGSRNFDANKTVTRGVGEDEYKIGATVREYPITYGVDGDFSALIHKKIIVNAGEKPVINGLDFKVIQQRGTFDPLENVTVVDDFDNDLTVMVTGFDDYLIGVQRLEYTTTDSDNNTTTSIRVVIVDHSDVFKVGVDYIIVSTDATLRKSNITDETITDSNLKSYNQVLVYDKKTGLLVINPVISVVKPSNLVANASVGEYPITYKLDAEEGLQTESKFNVITSDAPVIRGADNVSIEKDSLFDPKAGITILDDFDVLTVDDLIVEGNVDTAIPGVYKLTYKIKDSDLNETIVHRVVIVIHPGKIVTGTNYVIIAENYEIRKGQVNENAITDEVIINSANVRVYDKHTGLEITNPNIIVSKGVDAQEYKIGVDVGEYPIAFGIVEEDIVIESKVIVISGEAPKFIGTNNVELIKGSTGFDLFVLGESIDAEDGDLSNNQVEITTNGFDINKAGVYTVIYKLTDTDGNITEVTRIITVSSNNEIDKGPETSNNSIKVKNDESEYRNNNSGTIDDSIPVLEEDVDNTKTIVLPKTGQSIQLVSVVLLSSSLMIIMAYKNRRCL